MNDPIVQEVREARAAIAAEFNYDLGKYIAWIREETKARKAASHSTQAKEVSHPSKHTLVPAVSV